MARISVVIPVYNVEKYIGKMVESVLKQTFRDLELILVDDGSPDNSGAICDAYAEKDSRIQVIHKKNGGVSAARNDGLAVATGDYVLFCDGDDWMPPDACKYLCDAAKETDADVIFGDILRSWDDWDEYMRFFKEPFCTEDPAFIRELVKTNFYYTYCPFVSVQDRADGCYGGPWNKAVKRTLLLEHNVRFDVRLKGIYDDVIYSAYVLANAKKVSYCGKPVYNYRQVSQSTTHVFKSNILEINEAIFTSWMEFLKLYDVSGEWKQAYYANVIRRLDHAMEVYFLSDANPASEKARITELTALLKQEPYYTAERHVELAKLTKRHRVEAWLAAHDYVHTLWFVCSVNKLRKSKRSKR